MATSESTETFLRSCSLNTESLHCVDELFTESSVFVFYNSNNSIDCGAEEFLHFASLATDDVKETFKSSC